jgi:RHS repeat-associated protein
MDRMVALAQSTSASLKVTRALASSFSIAQQNRSLLHRAATTLQPNVASRYHCNQQYSVTAITDSSGAVQERYAYSAYGVPTIANASGTVLTASAISNRYMYTGREWDNDIQQYHYRARMYDASLGRFCSRDPISYGGKDQNLFRYVSGKPLDSIDPSGLKCANWYLMTDFYNLKGICKKVFPEFDKCEKVAPVCCWIKDGKKVCRDHYGTDPDDPIIPHWPDRDNCPLEKEDAYKYLLKLIQQTIPGNMKSGCRGRNKCDCGDFFSANIVCDDDMKAYFEEMVKRNMIPHNPCMRTYKWNCKTSQWEDPDGEPIPPRKAPKEKE